MNSLTEQLRVPVLTVLITILLLKIFGPIPFSVNSTVSNNSDMFTATATGEATGTPKTASFTIGVTKTGSTVEATQSQTNTAVNKIIDGLAKLGVDKKDIKTEDYSVNPNIDYTNGTQTTTGYTVSTNMTVKLHDSKKANAALDSATTNGANIIQGVNFVLSDEDQEKVEDEARAKAIENAKRKAEKVSKQAGITLGKVINIYETNPNDMMYDTSVRSEAANAKLFPSTELQPGENKVTIEVTLTYETL